MKLYAPIRIEPNQYVVEVIRKVTATDKIFLPAPDGGRARVIPSITPNVYICVHPDINNGNEFAVQLDPDTIGELEDELS